MIKHIKLRQFGKYSLFLFVSAAIYTAFARIGWPLGAAPTKHTPNPLVLI